MKIFECNIIGVYGEKGRAWLAQLPSQLSHYKHLWGLSQLNHVENITYNYVLKGFQGKNPIILKISLDDKALDREANALEAFKGYGAVAILDRDKHALLLQRAVPGMSLKSNVAVACDVAKKLHRASFKESDFPHIEDWLDTLDKHWNIPAQHLVKARQLKRELLANNRTQPVLLHGDLHQDNILSNGTDWLVIDPKGVIGFPINEMWACVEDPEKDTTFIADYFGYEYDEMLKWYYVHLILAACWQVEDRLDPTKFLNLANAVSPKIK